MVRLLYFMRCYSHIFIKTLSDFSLKSESNICDKGISNIFLQLHLGVKKAGLVCFESTQRKKGRPSDALVTVLK